MSSAFQGLVDASGRLKVSSAPIVSYFRGLPLSANGSLVFGAGPITRYSQGMPFNAAGQLVGLSAAGASRFGPGATAYGPNGELVGNSTDAIAVHHQGIPYTAGGAYASNGIGGGEVTLAKEFTLTAATISASSVGFRTSPAAGTLAPDAAYAGGTVDLVQFVNDDTVRVETVGDVVFPQIEGNLTMQLPAYLGPNRIIMAWDVNLYHSAIIPGIYNYMVSKIGVPIAMRLSGVQV